MNRRQFQEKLHDFGFSAKNYPVGFAEDFSRMYGVGKRVKTVTFAVTEKCALNCSYCYCENKSNATMTREVAKNCLDFLFAQDEAGSELINGEDAAGIVIDFIGGEPTDALDIMEYICDEFLRICIEKNHRWGIQHMFSFTTNGINCGTDAFKNFVEKYEGRVSYCVTVDGDKELHDLCRVFSDGSGSYDKAVEAFRYAQKRFGMESTKITVAPENIMFLSRAVKSMFTDLGVPRIQSNVVFEDVWSISDARTLYIQLKTIADWILEDNRFLTKSISYFDPGIGFGMDEEDNQNFCGGNLKMLCFDTHGKIYPCFRYTKIALPKNISPFVVGDCTHGIGFLNEERKHVDALTPITRRYQSDDECFYCPIASGCATCNAVNYQLTGDPGRRVKTVCGMHKARVLANSYYWNRLLSYVDADFRYPLWVPMDWALPIIGEKEFDLLTELSKED